MKHDINLLLLLFFALQIYDTNIDESISFSEICASGVTLFLYRNNVVDSITNFATTFGQPHSAFRDGLFYRNPLNTTEWAYYHNGVTEVFNEVATEPTTSDCYISWKSNGGSSGNPMVSFTLFNGFVSETVSTSGTSSTSQAITTLVNNQRYAIVQHNGEYRIIRVNFDLPCNVCTDLDIVTNTEENNISETWIQSTTSFIQNQDIFYRAENYIELNPGFQVPQNFVFKAEIGPCDQ